VLCPLIPALLPLPPPSYCLPCTSWPGLLGWLAAQVRPGLLSGALLLALGAALVGGGTAGAALLLGASYLAASTAAEARSAQQEAAAPTPGAAHSAGQQAGQGSVASSSSNRGPVAGTAAWLHHKLGNGSEVEGSSGGSSTPATPQQQQEQPSQLAGGALGKGAWAGTPAGAPRAGGDEDAEQDEGGGSSDLISSIITVGWKGKGGEGAAPNDCGCLTCSMDAAGDVAWLQAAVGVAWTTSDCLGGGVSEVPKQQRSPGDVPARCIVHMPFRHLWPWCT
jgi:hypothetical protein